MSLGTRGKYAEDKVKALFKSLAEKIAWFNYERLPDARAGSKQATICDFIVMANSQLYLVEVKQTESRNRLRYDHVPQIAKQRMWQLSGAIGIILVYHSESKVWRMAFADELHDTKEEKPVASWDMTVYNDYATAQEALHARLPGWPR